MNSRLSRRNLRLTIPICLLGLGAHPATAQLLGPEFQVNSYTTSYQRYPSVATDGSGNFVVAWQSFGQDGSAHGVFGQRVVWLFANGFESGKVCAWSSWSGITPTCP